MSSVHFALTAHINSGAKFSQEIFDLYLEFIKFIVKNVDSHTCVDLNVLKSFPVTKSSVSF